MRTSETAASLAPDAVAGWLDAIAPGEVRLLVGLDADGLTAACDACPPSRPVMLLDLDQPAADRVVETAVAQMARAVARLWPFLWDGEDFSSLRDDPLGRAHLPVRMAALARRRSGVSSAWAAAATRAMLRGRPPRVRQTGAAVEWDQLVRAFSPGGLIVVAPLAAPAREAGQVRALEWLAAHAPASVVALAPTLPEASDAVSRILFGALRVGRAPVAPQEGDERRGPRVVAAPPVDGRPHPLSAAEQRLHALIRADDDLRPLFEFNRTVTALTLLRPRVDVLWEAGRLVVELDGPEHRGVAAYRADRHRDYELLCAGYSVLRMTNEDVLEDGLRALDKVRRAVLHLRKAMR